MKKKKIKGNNVVPLPLKSKPAKWKNLDLSLKLSLSLSLKSTIIYALCFKANNHQTWSSLSKNQKRKSMFFFVASIS